MWYTLPILEQYSRFAGVYNDVRCVMTYLKAILLGLVQGIAEFLPISSSGHLAIARNLLNMEGAGSIPEFFDVLLHLGTLIAVFAAYWGDIRDMVVEFFRGIGDLAHHSTPTPVPPARRLILLIIVGTLPLFAVLSVLPAADDVVYIAAVCVLLFMVGLGCIAFVYSGTYHGAMEKLLEEGDYSRDNKGRRKVVGTISAVYWLIVTAVFLVMMFSPNTQMMPRETWIIWAVGGVLYAAVMAVVRLLTGRK